MNPSVRLVWDWIDKSTIPMPRKELWERVTAADVRAIAIYDTYGIMAKPNPFRFWPSSPPYSIAAQIRNAASVLERAKRRGPLGEWRDRT